MPESRNREQEQNDDDSAQARATTESSSSETWATRQAERAARKAPAGSPAPRSAGGATSGMAGSPAPHGGAVDASPEWTAGQLRTSVLELLDLWRQHGTGAAVPAFTALSGTEQRTLRDALKRRSLAEWETTFRRAKASDYLAGRDGTHAPMSLWRVLERASAIESGEYDARPVSGPRGVPSASRPELRDVSADIAAVQREQVLAAQERAARKAAAGGGAA